MKKIVFTLLISLMAASAFAQFSIGPKVALNFSNFSTNINTLKSDLQPGFDVGLFARIGKKLYVQPEVLYAFKSNEIKSIIGEAKNYKTHAIDVPVLVGYKLLSFGSLSNIRIFAGPKLSVLVGNNFEDTFKSTAFNYAGQAGLGVDLLMVTLDLRYDFAFNDIASVSDIKFRTNSFVISLGWKIL